MGTRIGGCSAQTQNGIHNAASGLLLNTVKDKALLVPAEKLASKERHEGDPGFERIYNPSQVPKIVYKSMLIMSQRESWFALSWFLCYCGPMHGGVPMSLLKATVNG